MRETRCVAVRIELGGWPGEEAQKTHAAADLTNDYYISILIFIIIIIPARIRTRQGNFAAACRQGLPVTLLLKEGTVM